jgi:putative membrane protein
MELTLYIGWLIVILALILILLTRKGPLKKKVLSSYFILLIITFLSYLYSILGTKVLLLDFIGSLWAYTAFAFVLIHSSLLLGKKKTAILFILALLFGSVSEIVGVKFGWIFGNYYYNPALSPLILGLVPLMTIVSWAIIIYISYSITNIIVLRGLNNKKPNINRDRMVFVILTIILLSAIDGLIATGLDMILDPVNVFIGGWYWIGGGPYFGIPISNFVGWFFVTFSATIIFRFYESFKQRELTTEKSFIINTAPIILYLMYFLIYGLASILIGKPSYLLIGTMTMVPFILIATLIVLINFLRVR